MPNPKRFPSLKALKVFQEAGRHLSFKRAADELFISPSAVSHQVRNLENYLGVQLFVRKTRSLEFTDAGRKYFAFLDETLANGDSIGYADKISILELDTWALITIIE